MVAVGRRCGLSPARLPNVVIITQGIRTVLLSVRFSFAGLFLHLLFAV